MNVWTVNQVTDNGSGANGTLSWAIMKVDGSAPGDTNTINFNLATPEITITGALPAITQPVTIDGWSQNNGTPGADVLINGAGDASNGLTVNTGGCTIRGLAIDQFGGNGIVLNNPIGSSDIVYSCNIGTDLTGIKGGVGNSGNGILIQGPTNEIGDACYWNVISGNARSGIYIMGANAQSNTIDGNYIGVDDTGLTAMANGGNGISIDTGAGNNTIGGQGPQVPSNVISGNTLNGVYISSSNSNQVLGNYIGVGVDGSTLAANGGSGVTVTNSGTGNMIGMANNGNVISGNTKWGVYLSGGSNLSGNAILANLIGTDSTGTAQKGNQQGGIAINSAPSNAIGGNSASMMNVISGNAGNGITISGTGANNNMVGVNLIGTNKAGTAGLGNGNDGIYVATNNNTIGAAGATTPPTIISGNGNDGIEIVGGNSNTVVNCYIGTDITGEIKIRNTNDGLGIGNNQGVGSTNNTIGGTAGVGWLNVISGNGGDGVSIWQYSTGNVLVGNYIGTDKTGNAKFGGINSLGNVGNGVYVWGSNNTIGAAQAGPGSNVISNNGGYGVYMVGSNNLVQNNNIGLGADGSTVLANTNGWRFLGGGTGNVWNNNNHN